MLKEELVALQNKLMDSASLVENMIKKSMEGLTQSKRALLTEVVEKDEQRENDLELQIDEACIHLIACYQPQAKDLRTILMVLKMNNDLERIGDEAVNISEGALDLIDQHEIKFLNEISKMADEAISMLKDSLKSLTNEDTRLARQVCERDDIVDDLRDEILKELFSYMASYPNRIKSTGHLVRISRSLERIADLSTNICEDVIYLVEGRTIRHHGF